MHPERLENQPTERRIEGFARDRFHNALEPDETLAGIAETLARWKVRLEWKIDRAPIGQTRCVAQNVPYSDGSRRGSSVT